MPLCLPETDRRKRALANLYNIHPNWLDLVHKKPVVVAFASYSFPENLPDDDVLDQLLKLDLQRAG